MFCQINLYQVDQRWTLVTKSKDADTVNSMAEIPQYEGGQLPACNADYIDSTENVIMIIGNINYRLKNIAPPRDYVTKPMIIASRDGGKTWSKNTKIFDDDPLVGSYIFYSFRNKILFAYGKHTYYSRDFGSSWDSIPLKGTPIESNAKFHPEIYKGDACYGDFLFYSSNDIKGNNTDAKIYRYNLVTKEWKVVCDISTNQMEGRPKPPEYPYSVFSKLYIAGQSTLYLVSSFAFSATGIPPSDPNAQKMVHIYRSDDNGDTWKRVGFLPQNITFVYPPKTFKNDIYFAITSKDTASHFYTMYSGDNGNSWEYLNAENTFFILHTINANCLKDFVFGSDISYNYISKNLKTWSCIDPGFPTVNQRFPSVSNSSLDHNVGFVVSPLTPVAAQLSITKLPSKVYLYRMDFSNYY